MYLSDKNQQTYNLIMKRKILCLILFFGAVFMLSSNSVESINSPKITETFLENDSLFGKSQATGLDYVLRLDPDRLLVPCYKALGKSTKAFAYGGWESRQIAGHSLGHYLFALAGFYHATGNAKVKEKLDYTVNCLSQIQRNDGYLGGVPSAPFDAVASGTFNVDRFGLANYWVPWYSVHKIYAGLLDAYTYGKNEKALDIVKKIGDWCIIRFANVSEENFQRMLTCEHGGMCKVFADLYGITDEEKYLIMAERFIHKEIMNPAMNQKDALQGYHANTQIPKFLGIARLYELTGKTEYRTAAEFFFDVVTNKRSYVIGGNSKGEHFGPQFQESTGRDTCETCNTYNMLELSEHIFAWNQNPQISDYCETALFNHILASQEPRNGSKMYFVSTESGFFKVYGTDYDSFWCCTGTGMENPERYNRYIFQKQNGILFVNQFISSEYSDTDMKLKLTTNFPFENTLTLEVLKSDKNASVKVRIPKWAIEAKITRGTKTINAGQYGKSEYYSLDNLQQGEKISFTFPMKLSIRKTQDGSGNFNILYGPVVLGAALGNKGMPNDVVADHLSLMNAPGSRIQPIVAELNNPEAWIKISDSEKLEFVTTPEINRRGEVYTLKPFFNIHHERYALYFNGSDVKDNARLEKYKGRIVDSVECGRQQPEIEHRFKSDFSDAGYNMKLDKSYRTAAKEGGYFTYNLKIASGIKNTLVVSFYANQNLDGKTAKLKIIADKEELAIVNVEPSAKEDLYDVEIELPDFGKKSKLNIRFETPEDSDICAEVYEVRTVKN
jgi:DUF1680 family protein